MKFRLGHNYGWILAVYMLFVLVTMAAAAIHPVDWDSIPVVASAPCLLLFLVVSELRSGIALDSWGVARYPRPSAMFVLLVTWHCFATIAFAVLAAYLLSPVVQRT